MRTWLSRITWFQMWEDCYIICRLLFIERKLRGNYWTCCKTLPEIFLHEHCSWCWRQIERLRYICTIFFHTLPPTQPARRIHGVLVGRTHVDPRSNIPSHFSQRKQRSQFFTNMYTGCSFQIPTFVLKLYIISLYQQLIQAIQSPSKF